MPGVGDDRIEFEPPRWLKDRVLHLGWTRVRSASESSLCEHTHLGAIELCFVRSGLLDWWAGADFVTVRPQHGFVTRADEPHGAVNSVLQPCEIFWVQVREEAFDPAWRPYLDRLFSQRSFFAPSLAPAFERLIAEHREDRAGSAIAANAALDLLLVEMVRCGGQLPVTRVYPEVSRAQAHARERLDEPLRVQDMARAAATSVAWLTHLFHRTEGEAPGVWLRRERIRSAKRQLIETDDSVTSIALAHGFGTSQYFATAFRKETGTSPSDYRRRARGELVG
jgi:AraC-like DNA-binding protein